MVVIDARRRYRLVSGLLYPATLGAAIAWWVQAATWRPVASQDGPMPWALGFGAWFLIYHAVWYVQLVGEHDDPSHPFAYPVRRFVSDLVDVAAIIAAFAALGFASGQFHLFLPGVFAAAGLIPLSSLIGRSHRRLGNTALIAIAGLASVVGIIVHLRSDAPGITSLDVTLQREFWLVLLAYLFVPSIFGARISRAPPRFSTEIYSGK